MLVYIEQLSSKGDVEQTGRHTLRASDTWYGGVADRNVSTLFSMDSRHIYILACWPSDVSYPMFRQTRQECINEMLTSKKLSISSRWSGRSFLNAAYRRVAALTLLTDGITVWSSSEGEVWSGSSSFSSWSLRSRVRFPRRASGGGLDLSIASLIALSAAEGKSWAPSLRSGRRDTELAGCRKRWVGGEPVWGVLGYIENDLKTKGKERKIFEQRRNRTILWSASDSSFWKLKWLQDD